MRIDKYLWCIRLFKTRSIATAAVKQGKVKVGGLVVKASRDVFPTDKIEIRKNHINYQIEVTDLPKSRVGAKLVDQYRIDKTPKEAFDRLKEIQSSQEYYRKKGQGRPTKKDRRDIDNWSNNAFLANKNEEE